jgi:hypothetical protein
MRQHDFDQHAADGGMGQVKGVGQGAELVAEAGLRRRSACPTRGREQYQQEYPNSRATSRGTTQADSASAEMKPELMRIESVSASTTAIARAVVRCQVHPAGADQVEQAATDEERAIGRNGKESPPSAARPAA